MCPAITVGVCCGRPHKQTFCWHFYFYFYFIFFFYLFVFLYLFVIYIQLTWVGGVVCLNWTRKMLEGIAMPFISFTLVYHFGFGLPSTVYCGTYYMNMEWWINGWWNKSQVKYFKNSLSSNYGCRIKPAYLTFSTDRGEM